jgi:hypothetical protein
MKWKMLLLLVFVGFKTFSQELPINPQTGPVSIKDSFEVKNKSLQEIKEMMKNWGHTLIDIESVKQLYKLNNSKQTEMINITLPIENPVLTQDKGGNKFLTNGTLYYNKTKTNGLNQYAPVIISGSVKFNFSYTITSQKLIYELTSIEYSHDMNHYGKFEDEKPPQDYMNKSLVFKMSKKEYAEVKAEYFQRLKILGDNLKEYATTILKSNQASVKQSPVNYESYKQIKTGMAYDEVVKLLVDEGKELRVTQKTIVWNDLDKTKSITVTFTDGKVASKSQINL